MVRLLFVLFLCMIIMVLLMIVFIGFVIILGVNGIVNGYNFLVENVLVLVGVIIGVFW